MKATLQIYEHKLFRILGSVARNEGEWEILYHENVTACKEEVRSKESSLRRAQLKPDGTRWRTVGEVKGKYASGVGSQ